MLSQLTLSKLQGKLKFCPTSELNFKLKVKIGGLTSETSISISNSKFPIKLIIIPFKAKKTLFE